MYFPIICDCEFISISDNESLIRPYLTATENNKEIWKIRHFRHDRPRNELQLDFELKFLKTRKIW